MNPSFMIGDYLSFDRCASEASSGNPSSSASMASSGRPSLCNTFQNLSAKTWKDLHDASVDGFSLGEESITDYLLLELMRLHKREIKIKKFSKRKESKTGADWEWFFHSGDDWFGMRVQAKKLDSLSLEYPQINHGKGKQVKVLLDGAKREKLYPMYCFYNFWDVNQHPLPLNCPTYYPKGEYFGCTVADAYFVKNILPKKIMLENVLPHSMPWMCLVCCKHGGPTLPGRVREFANRLRRDQTNETNKMPSVPEIVKTDNLPSYVKQIYSGEHQELPKLEGVGGIVIVDEIDE